MMRRTFIQSAMAGIAAFFGWKAKPPITVRGVEVEKLQPVIGTKTFAATDWTWVQYDGRCWRVVVQGKGECPCDE